MREIENAVHMSLLHNDIVLDPENRIFIKSNDILCWKFILKYQKYRVFEIYIYKTT